MAIFLKFNWSRSKFNELCLGNEFSSLSLYFVQAIVLKTYDRLSK